MPRGIICRAKPFWRDRSATVSGWRDLSKRRAALSAINRLENDDGRRDEHFIRESEEVNRLYFEAGQIDRLEFVAQACRDHISSRAASCAKIAGDSTGGHGAFRRMNKKPSLNATFKPGVDFL